MLNKLCFFRNLYARKEREVDAELSYLLSPHEMEQWNSYKVIQVNSRWFKTFEIQKRCFGFIEEKKLVLVK